MVEATTPAKAAKAQPVDSDKLSLKKLVILWHESNQDPILFSKKIAQEASKP